jgi:hypothetical protein
MDQNESTRKFEQLMLKAADHAHGAANELEALVLLLPDKSRQLAPVAGKGKSQTSQGISRVAQSVNES